MNQSAPPEHRSCVHLEKFFGKIFEEARVNYTKTLSNPGQSDSQEGGGKEGRGDEGRGKEGRGDEGRGKRKRDSKDPEGSDSEDSDEDDEDKASQQENSHLIRRNPIGSLLRKRNAMIKSTQIYSPAPTQNVRSQSYS